MEIDSISQLEHELDFPVVQGPFLQYLQHSEAGASSTKMRGGYRLRSMWDQETNTIIRGLNTRRIEQSQSFPSG